MTSCEICDRPVATDDQWRDVPEGERDDLCWGGIQCGEARVDWRARAMRADEQVTVEKRCQVNLVARLEAADRERNAWEADARKAWSRADDEEEMRKQACRDLAAAMDERDAARRDLNQVCLAHQHERETRIAAEARAERLEGFAREVADDLRRAIALNMAPQDARARYRGPFASVVHLPSVARDLKAFEKRARRALGEP